VTAHDTVEPVAILELAQDLGSKSLSIDSGDCNQIVGRMGDTEARLAQIGRFVDQLGATFWFRRKKLSGSCLAFTFESRS